MYHHKTFQACFECGNGIATGIADLFRLQYSQSMTCRVHHRNSVGATAFFEIMYLLGELTSCSEDQGVHRPVLLLIWDQYHKYLHYLRLILSVVVNKYLPSCEYTLICVLHYVSDRLPLISTN
eukprot:Blabericola_migrator_1__10312@NODE_579_length_7498_cov_41_155295_g429_i0_p3_GENE_NODE_579_length_7498_cov_41_155295_g429_i0NODE_579_length_7498_cov_41_155295_g429_i0_p3_ORF_typecomplete_len123_score2_21_NODE_579_length_7498_cov_41_155295_g429_i011771545